MEGWIKLHRKLIENAIFYKPDYFQVWVYILLKVNHEEKTFIWNNEPKTIKKGCGIFSQKAMCSAFGYSLSKINRILNYLKNENQININSTNKYTEIEVINWEEYQDIFDSGNQTETKRKANGKQKETQRKPSGNLAETNKNEKNYKNEKNEEEIREILLPFDSDVFFEKWQLWKKYRLGIKKPYKTNLSEQAALKNLCEISGGDELKALKIIENSIANQWQGLFELKENGKQTTKKDFGINIDTIIASRNYE